VKAERSGAPQKSCSIRSHEGKRRIEGQREMLLPIAGKKGKETAKANVRLGAAMPFLRDG
jgi:hypothetical protein